MTTPTIIQPEDVQEIPPGSKPTGQFKSKALKIDPETYVPLTGQQALFSAEEIAAARGEVVADTAPEDRPAFPEKKQRRSPKKEPATRN